jgi:hypothetical protein
MPPDRLIGMTPLTQYTDEIATQEGIPDLVNSSRSTRQSKWLIGVIVLVGCALAAFSWWFRFAATHRAAEFWGGDNFRLIRDAAIVEAYVPAADDDPSRLVAGAAQRDIAQFPGMTHLRNALLEDRSFVWVKRQLPPPADWNYGLRFADEKREVLIDFSADGRQLRFAPTGEHRCNEISCAPISAGLKKMFGELFLPTTDAR